MQLFSSIDGDFLPSLDLGQHLVSSIIKKAVSGDEIIMVDYQSGVLTCILLLLKIPLGVSGVLTITTTHPPLPGEGRAAVENSPVIEYWMMECS